MSTPVILPPAIEQLPDWIENPPGFEAVPPQRPAVPPPAMPVLEELASDLEGLALFVAARLVREGRREYAGDIVRDIKARNLSLRDLHSEQVAAWGEGRDEAVLASNEAYDCAGCDLCARAALVSGDAADTCADCAPGGA